jgi:hypothetical protein
MTSKTTQAVRNAIATALCMTGFAGFSSTSLAAPPAAEPALKSLERADDLTLPAIAKHGTGSVGALNAKALDAPAMSFALPDGRVLSATRQRTADDKNKGRKSWIGTFAEQPGSIAVVTTYKGVTTGFVTFGAETWEVMPAKAGKHMLYRVDDSKLPTVEPEPVMSEAEKDLAATASDADLGTTTTATAGGHVQDLLVVYTPAASAAYGQATLESMIQNAVAVANQAYQNSKVGITLNLVGLQQIAYTEVDIQASLDDLRGTTDGKMDSVHRLRDQVGADIVSLISQDTGACGIARVMTSVSTAFAPYAFNVVKTSCLSQHSLAHEIGHNQGNKHDRDSSTEQGAYPYSYGFRRCTTDGTGFRTVMGYPCSGAARVAWFSNPDAYYNGFATGIDHESDPANSADNARSMNNTAATIAALRGAGDNSTATVAPTSPTAPSSLTASATAYNSVTVRWADNSNDETGFRLERSRNGVDFTEIATLGAGTTSFVDNGVAASSSYYYKVRAYNSNGNSSYSNTGSVTTPALPAPAPAAPASIAAVNDGDGSATVSWVDASTNERGFEIRREKWDAKRSRWGGLTTVGTLPSNLTSLVDVSGNGTYRYSVRAVNTGGASGLTGPAAVTVTGAPTKGKGRR